MLSREAYIGNTIKYVLDLLPVFVYTCRRLIDLPNDCRYIERVIDILKIDVKERTVEHFETL